MNFHFEGKITSTLESEETHRKNKESERKPGKHVIWKGREMVEKWEKKITGMPREWREETAASRTCLRRPMIAMEAPCFPNCLDISYPIPDPPPVSSATFPFSISPLNGDSIFPLSLSLSLSLKVAFSLNSLWFLSLSWVLGQWWVLLSLHAKNLFGCRE